MVEWGGAVLLLKLKKSKGTGVSPCMETMHISNYSGIHLLGLGHPLVRLLSMAAFIPQQDGVLPRGL